MSLHSEWTPERLQHQHSLIRLGKTLVTLDSLVAAHENGTTPEEFVERFPSLQLGDVTAALAYALDHWDDVTVYMARRRQEALADVRKWVAKYLCPDPRVTGLELMSLAMDAMFYDFHFPHAMAIYALLPSDVHARFLERMNDIATKGYYLQLPYIPGPGPVVNPDHLMMVHEAIDPNGFERANSTGSPRG